MALKLSSIYGSGVPKPTELLPALNATISGVTGDADTERVIFDLTGKFAVSYLGRAPSDNNKFGIITKVEVDGVEVLTGNNTFEVIGHAYAEFNPSSPYVLAEYNLAPEMLRCNQSIKVWAKSNGAGRSSNYLLLATAIE